MQPLLRTDKLVSLIRKKSETGTLSPSESLLLEQELQSLAQIDPAQADSIRAYVLSVEGEFETSCLLHEELIRSMPDDPLFVGNYAASLSVSGKHDQAAHVFLQAWELDRTDTHYLASAISEARACANAELTTELEAKYAGLTGKPFMDPSAAGVFPHNVAGTTCFTLACRSGTLKDWEHPDEEEAWCTLL